MLSKQVPMEDAKQCGHKDSLGIACFVAWPSTKSPLKCMLNYIADFILLILKAFSYIINNFEDTGVVRFPYVHEIICTTIYWDVNALRKLYWVKTTVFIFQWMCTL